MSNTIFTDYPDVPEIASDTNSVPKKSIYDKKFKKQLKKQNRLLKQLVELIKRRRPEEQPTVEETNTKKNSFLSKLGDAVVKALPSILSAVASAVIGYFAAKPRQAACHSGR